jgi:hypothetical protein
MSTGSLPWELAGVDPRSLRIEPMGDFSFDPSTHIYTSRGLRVPSVTQAIKLLPHIGADYSRVDPEDLERKRAIGVLVHDACAILDEGDDLDWGALGESRGYVEGYRRFLLDTRFRPRLIEYHRVAAVTGMKYGMKLDREGVLGREPVVLDIKTAEQVEPSWGIQTAAYALGLPRPVLPPFQYTRYAVILKPNGTYKLHTFDDPDDPGVFKSALHLAYWAIRHGKKLE